VRPVGFSTGAFAPGNLDHAVEVLSRLKASAVELSALRLHELPALLEFLPRTDLTRFSYVAIHAPGSFKDTDEEEVIKHLHAIPESVGTIVVHPDSLYRVDAWRAFGSRLCIENMDKRKPTGRHARELARIFSRLPDASFCFDIGHARQVDPTMTTAAMLLRDHAARLRQIHASEVDAKSRHCALSLTSQLAFRKVLRWIPPDVPLILESVVSENQLAKEMQFASTSLEEVTSFISD
jgi:sugar phosphate isomerase/epimerase